MKKVIIICNTYFQLIVAMQFKFTIKKDEFMHIVITSQSKNARQVYGKLKNTHLFDKLSFLDVNEKRYQKTSFLNSIRLIKYGLFGDTLGVVEKDAKYDEFLSFNLDLPAHYLYARLIKNNPDMVCNQFEEGIISYGVKESYCGVLNVFYKIRKMFGKHNLRTHTKNFYCFNPESYLGSRNALMIPKILPDSAIKQYMSEIFFDGKNVIPYKEKYIFLPCIYDIEGGEPIGELELAKEIAELVGKENLVVKVHPRDNAERFVAVGLKVDTNSTVPWEAIQLNGDFSDKVFLTSLSGSILTINTILNNCPKSFYLYNLCDLSKNGMARHFKGVIESFLGNENGLNFKNIYVAQNFEEILN